MMLRIRPRKQHSSLVEVVLFEDYCFNDLALAIDEAVSSDRPFAVLNRVGTEMIFDPRRLDAVALVQH